MADFSDDRTSGSGQVAQAFLVDLERWVAVDTSTSAHALRAALIAYLRDAQAAQPSMALIHQLAARALDVADAGARREDSPQSVRDALQQSCVAERSDLRAGQAAVARTAAQLVTQTAAWIATLSASSLVREALKTVKDAGRDPRVLVGEGRPRFEGRLLAADLGRIGIPVWLVADAGIPLLLSQASMVWLGADAVTDRGVINKIGSYAAALAAREHGVPVYVLAERRKFLPGSTRALKIAEMPPGEIWDAPTGGVQPRNVYFELVPLDLIRGVVVEDGVLGGSEASVVARERPLPEELRG